MAFDFERVLKHLTDGTPDVKMRAWDILFLNIDHLTPEHQPQLHHVLRNETDPKVKPHGTERLLAIFAGLVFRSVYPPGESTLFNCLWHRFLGAPLDLCKSAIIGICDRAHLKDVPVVVKISRVLSQVAAPNAEFLFIPLNQWNVPSDYAALCFIGRDSFYECCPPAIRSGLQGGQFRMPRLQDQMQRFGAPLSPESKIHFHHIGREHGGYRIKYMPHESHGFRVDYGVVRRFHILLNGHRASGLSLAGPTSLGTAGAGAFATKYSTAWPWPKNLKPDADFEILLKVVARIDPDLRPWVVHDHRVIKWHPGPDWGDPETDGGGMPPYAISQGPIPPIVVVEGDAVRDVLVDGLPPDSSDAERALLRLIFGLWRKLKVKAVTLDEVLADPGCPEILRRNRRPEQVTYLRDHVQRILTPNVSIRGQEITFNVAPCEVNWADLAPSAEREIQQQAAFEQDYGELLKPACSPQDLLTRHGVILGFDGSEFPTVIRLSRVE